jgi:hypothetical protein
MRHYSPKTLKTYRSWVRQFQAFVHSKDPKSLTTDDVKSFLTDLGPGESYDLLLYDLGHGQGSRSELKESDLTQV